MRRVLFMGQKYLGEAAWNRLRQTEGNGYQIVAVCSNRSAEVVWWRSNRIFKSLGELPFVDNHVRNEELLLDIIHQYQVDTVLAVQHPWILSHDILAAVNYNVLNFHNAKLPGYRGYNAVNHAILNRDQRFTCTVHWMADAVDKGDIAFEATFDISPTETAISLYAKCHHAGLRLFDKVLLYLDKMEMIPRRPIVGAGRFYPRKSIEALREIKNPLSDEAEIKSRAFFLPPFEPAFIWNNDRKLYILPEHCLELGFETASTNTLRSMIDLTSRGFSCELS
jgi:methionyl-tRNA formyltransferase